MAGRAVSIGIGTDLGEAPARMNARMIFTPDRSAMYIAVPKTGCTTIKVILAASVGMVGGEALQARNRAGIHDAWRNREVNWSKLTDGQREALLTGATTFRFTSVRNPFERLVSCYLNKIVEHGWGNALGRRMRDLGVKSLLSFLEVVARQPPLRRDVHCRAMVDLCHADRISFDDIVRYETFEADLRRVMARCNAADFDIPKPTWRNKTDAGLRMRELLGPRECDLIRHIYRRDFEMFGYAMDLPPA